MLVPRSVWTAAGSITAIADQSDSSVQWVQHHCHDSHSLARSTVLASRCRRKAHQSIGVLMKSELIIIFTTPK